MNITSTRKISPAFLKCLRELRPDQRARAIILLDTEADCGQAKGASETRRQAMSRVCAAASQELDRMDTLLAAHNGQRLTAPNALGSVVVEGTAPALYALADLPAVKAVLEDQPVALLR